MGRQDAVPTEPMIRAPGALLEKPTGGRQGLRRGALLPSRQ